MAYEDQIRRRALEKRARHAQPKGIVQDNAWGVQESGATDRDIRDEGRFLDQTGDTIVGFGVVSEMLT